MLRFTLVLVLALTAPILASRAGPAPSGRSAPRRPSRLPLHRGRSRRLRV